MGRDVGYEVRQKIRRLQFRCRRPEDGDKLRRFIAPQSIAEDRAKIKYIILIYAVSLLATPLSSLDAYD